MSSNIHEYRCSYVHINGGEKQCSFHSTISMGVMKHPLWSDRTPLGELDFHTSYSTQKGFIKHPTTFWVKKDTDRYCV